MQRKTKLLVLGLIFSLLAFGNNISYTQAANWTNQACYSLSVVVDGGMGLPPAASEPNCDSGRYLEGSAVTLTALPDPGFTVSVWRGTDDDTSTAGTNTVTMTGDKEVGVLYGPTAANVAVSADVSTAMATNGSARVIITLKDPVSIQASGEVRATAVAQTQALVLVDLAPAGFELYRQYSHVPALAGTITPEALTILQNNPWVASVDIDGTVYATTDVSLPAIHADDVHAMGITGDGVTVAVLDTGIDTDHPDLSDDLIAQHCFNQLDCPPSNTNESTSAEDEQGHGTNVSGIITSNGVVAPLGFAPDAKIVAVRVLNSSGSGSFSDILAGINWIIANQGTLSVDVLNMSLGGSIFTSNCDSALPSMANAFSQLNGLGIVNFVASGNDGASTGIDIPACMSNVIAVGAVYDSDLGREPDFPFVYGSGCFDETTAFGKITCFSNGSSLLDILAPGAPITSAGLGGGTSTMYGTSQATPTAAGVAALLREADPSLTPAEIESILESTGTLVTDARNGLQFPLIDALEAVSPLITPTTPPTLVSPLNRAFMRTATPVFMWEDSSGPPLFQLQVDNNSDFSSPIIDVNTEFTFYPSPINLPDGRYYWRVSNQPGTDSGWSESWTLMIDTVPPAKPVLLLPANNAVTTDSTPLLRWRAVAGGFKYRLIVDDTPNMSSPIIAVDLTTTSYTVPNVLLNGRYYWWVRAYDRAGNMSPWSTRWNFRVTGGLIAPQIGFPAAETFTPEPTQTATPLPTDTPTPTLTPTGVVIDPLLRLESDEAVVQQTGVWTSHTTDVASGGSYLYSSGSFDDTLTLPFMGTQVKVVYVRHPALGTFAIEIDGAVMQLVSSTAPESEFGVETVVSELENGQHLLRIYPVAGVIAIDAFEIETLPDPANTPSPTPTDLPVLTPTGTLPGEPTQTATPSSTPLPLTLPFVETFDSGLGWQPTGVWFFDTLNALNGAGWFAESLTRGLSSTLTFESQIDLRAAINPQLTYWYKLSLVDTDFFALDISQDSGLTWQVLDLQPGQVTDWTQRLLDLTPYRGQVITLRFRLDTLGLVTSDTVAMGVWVDELMILETLPTPTPSPVTVTATGTPIPTETATPTASPTDVPTATSTTTPTDIPTATPTTTPTDIPTATPTATPTDVPTATPTTTPEPSVLPAVTEEPAS